MMIAIRPNNPSILTRLPIQLIKPNSKKTWTFQQEEPRAAGERDRGAGADGARVLPRPQADVAGTRFNG